MKRFKSLPITALSSAIAILGSALLSPSVLADTSYYNAPVIESSPVYRNIETSSPHQECWQEEVARTESRRQQGSRTPGLLGAIVGGAIGNAVGHHKRNQQVGTVVGAILGASIGTNIGRENADNGNRVVYYDTVEHCKTVYDYRQEEKLVGYDVLYSYNGSEYSLRMPRDPGATVRLRVNVEPVL